MQLYLFEKVIFGFETLLFRATVMERVGTNHVLFYVFEKYRKNVATWELKTGLLSDKR